MKVMLWGHDLVDVSKSSSGAKSNWNPASSQEEIEQTLIKIISPGLGSHTLDEIGADLTNPMLDDIIYWLS